MTASLPFGIGLALTLMVSLLMVRYMSGPLQKLLQDPCSDAPRSEFWALSSNVRVSLIPLIFAMGFEPDPNCSGPWVVETANQLKWGPIGLAVSVLMLGWILSRFIPRTYEQEHSALNSPSTSTM